MLRTNKTRHREWYGRCTCKCRLDASVCNNKQRQNYDKCRCKCKELIDKGVCDKGFVWNLSNCESESDKSCDVGKYLDYENCKCRKKLVEKLAVDCTENIDEVKIASENEDKNKCSSYTLYIVLPSIIFRFSIGIGIYFVYYKYMNRNKENVSQYDHVNQAKNY